MNAGGTKLTEARLAGADCTRDILSAFEALQEGIAVFNDDDKLALFNARFRDSYKPMGGLLKPGIAWQMFLAEAERRDLARGFDQIDARLDAGLETSFTLEAARPGERWVRLGFHPTSEGGFVITQTDITEMRLAEEMRAEAEELTRDVLDACDAMILMTRISSGEIIYQTPAARALLGQKKSARDIYAKTEERSDFLVELLATGVVDDFNVQLRNADGAAFPARVSSRLVDYRGEDVIVSSGHDMTQFYAQQDEIMRMRETALQQEKLSALGGLLAGVAHELNNPLSVVVGHAMMLREEIDDPDVSARLGKIGASAERCARIVKTFLAMARQKPAALVPAPLNAIVETALDVADSSLDADAPRFEKHLCTDDTCVLADEDQIAQVLINLLTNASQAVKPLGAKAVVAVTTRLDERRNEIVCEVADNGPGVPAHLRRRVFEPFYTTKTVGEGTGLGLALCYRIVTAHGGRMEVGDSDAGGALFSVALPRAPMRRKAVRAHDSAPGLVRLKALVIEDEEDVGETIVAMLKSFNVSADLVLSGREALEAISAGEQYDVVLSDLKMPGLSGLETAREIERRWPALAPRIAFITGDPLGAEAREVVSGGKRLLEKPVAPDDLLEFIRMVAEG